MEMYSVVADAITGEWLGQPKFMGTVNASEWAKRADTEGRHFDTYEVSGVTRAIEVVFSSEVRHEV